MRIIDFYPRPPGGGRPGCAGVGGHHYGYFYPRPPGGGRLLRLLLSSCTAYFYPRPPGGGRLALVKKQWAAKDFYPRPPGGGRPNAEGALVTCDPFLSTPSGWRATVQALENGQILLFLSTPSGWRATETNAATSASNAISIHALRVEGDGVPQQNAPGNRISIHALRVEGDRRQRRFHSACTHFYPRPPGGGRLVKVDPTASGTAFLSTPSGWRATGGVLNGFFALVFLSTPSGWRATVKIFSKGVDLSISIHALRVEGDL